MKTIYIIRHGETESNKNGIFRGRLDIPLSKAGEKQAKDLRKYFKDKCVDIVFTSPLSRAVKTAEIAFPKNEIIRTENLNNLDLGMWKGMEKDKLKKRSPKLWKKWIESPEKIIFPKGESIADVYIRVEKFLSIIKEIKEKSIAVVSHRSVNKIILAACIGLKENYFWKFHLDNCSVSIILFEKKRGFTIFKLNHTDHLTHTVMEWY